MAKRNPPKSKTVKAEIERNLYLLSSALHADVEGADLARLLDNTCVFYGGSNSNTHANRTTL